MELKRARSQPAQKGPAENFIGIVRIPCFLCCRDLCIGRTHRLGTFTRSDLDRHGWWWTECEGEIVARRRCGLVSA